MAAIQIISMRVENPINSITLARYEQQLRRHFYNQYGFLPLYHDIDLVIHDASYIVLQLKEYSNITDF